jgi:CheY-like chemotaxis protein
MNLSERASDAPAGAHCILVVDSEVLIRMVIAQYLRECGYRVIEAATTDEAVAVLKHPDLAVDIILSDAETPGEIDAFSLARWARENKPGTHVILTASPARASDAASDLCESGPLVSKPYEPQSVLDRIRRLLGERASRK